jgi:hypothetical protein
MLPTFRWIPIATKALAVALRVLCMETSELIDYGIKCSKVVKLEITQVRRI